MREHKAPALHPKARRGSMLISAQSLYGYKLLATDGEIGAIYEFYFNDESWAIWYFVANTGAWLKNRKVLISPVSIGKPDYDAKMFPVTISRDQVWNSPEADERKPVSRQHQADLSAHYGWPIAGPYGGELPSSDFKAEQETTSDRRENDPHLRSTREVIGYTIQAADGGIGHVDDFIIDDGNWGIRYFVADTGRWLPGKRVILAPQWISEISWEQQIVYVDLSRDEVRNSPEFDPSAPVNSDYEEQLYDYYGRRKYWT